MTSPSHCPPRTRTAITGSNDGLIRWVVFQRTKRGRFRLTQYLFAPDKATASATARAWYAGCAGTLELMSFAEYQAVLDDLDALRRTRVSPVEPGQRRPNMKRGISYGCCVWCGAVTQSRGGKPPKYCASHRDRAHQRAYRTSAAVVGSIRPVVVPALQRQVVGA